MLSFFPEDRITAQDALAHPFFKALRRPDAEVRTCGPSGGNQGMRIDKATLLCEGRGVG
jgi:hypothetical protein